MLELIANFGGFYLIIYKILGFVNHLIKFIKNRCTTCGVAWINMWLIQLTEKGRSKYLTNLKHSAVEANQREFKI